MRKILLLLTLFISTTIYSHSHCDSIFSSGCSGSEIKIKTPSTVESPGFVPVTVNFNTDVKGGEIIKVFIDNNIAFMIEPFDSVSINKLSLRLRAVETNGTVKVEVDRYNGVTGSNTDSFLNKDSYKIPNISSTKTKHKLKAKKGNIRFIHRNKMGVKTYLEKVKFNTDNGKINVTLTPYSSGEDGTELKGFPLGGYFAIWGDFNNTKVDKVQLNNDY